MVQGGAKFSASGNKGGVQKAKAKARTNKKGRVATTPKNPVLKKKKDMQKKLAAQVGKDLEESLAAKAGNVKPLTILQNAAKAGKDAGKDGQKTGRGMKKK